MAAYRSGFGDLLEPGFREIFDDNFKEKEQVFPQLFHVNTSAKQDEKDSAVSGFGLMQETAEGAPIDYEDPVQMYDVTYTHLKYTKGFKVSREMYEDDLYNIMNKKPAALGKSARRTAENQAAQVFINAFTSTQLGGDGEELCSTVHPRADGSGSTQSNASATGITLTEENLETALVAMRDQLDDKGQVIDIMPSVILVPIDLRKTAHLIVDSPLRQGTADNDANVYKNQFQIIDWIYLTSTTAWFLIDKNQHELNWFWRIRPEFKQDDSFDTDMALYKSRQRFSRGFSDWRGVWGSAGNAAAYSS